MYISEFWIKLYVLLLYESKSNFLMKLFHFLKTKRKITHSFSNSFQACSHCNRNKCHAMLLGFFPWYWMINQNRILNQILYESKWNFLMKLFHFQRKANTFIFSNSFQCLQSLLGVSVMLCQLAISIILNDQSIRNERKWAFFGKIPHHVFYGGLIREEKQK